MTPDFVIARGDTPAIAINIANLWTVSGAPFALTFTVKGDVNLYSTPVIQKSVNGITPVVSGVTPVTIQLLTTDTQIPPGFYNYDFKLYNTGNTMSCSQANLHAGDWRSRHVMNDDVTLDSTVTTGPVINVEIPTVARLWTLTYSSQPGLRPNWRQGPTYYVELTQTAAFMEVDLNVGVAGPQGPPGEGGTLTLSVTYNGSEPFDIWVVAPPDYDPSVGGEVMGIVPADQFPNAGGGNLACQTIFINSSGVILRLVFNAILTLFGIDIPVITAYDASGNEGYFS